MITADEYLHTTPVWDFETFEREIGSLYFPVETQTNDRSRFSAQLSIWQIGTIDIARMRSGQLSHSRKADHIRKDSDAYLLLPITCSTPITLHQGTTDLSICKNQFLIQLSETPFEYVQCVDGSVWTVKIPVKEMVQFLPSPERYATHAFDTQTGMGRLFSDLVQTAPLRRAELGRDGSKDLSRIILEVLAMTLENDSRLLGSRQKPVRQAMLARIERYIRQNISSPDLTVDNIAAAAGISVRYLHELFKESSLSVSRWILEQRLIACEKDLRRSTGETVAEVGYRWGFRDSSHFSRVFRKRFGVPPKEWQRSLDEKTRFRAR